MCVCMFGQGVGAQQKRALPECVLGSRGSIQLGMAEGGGACLIKFVQLGKA